MAVVEARNSSAMPIMSGIRPIEMIAQVALCEQAPTSNPHNYFCMAELLRGAAKSADFS